MTVKAKITSTATRKLGPLPTWAWALALIGSLLVYRHVRASREQTIGGQFSLPAVRAATPVNPAPAEGASGGGGPAMPELPSDLLAQFFAHQTATIDALTAALTSTPAGQAAPLDSGGAPSSTALDGPASGPAPTQVTAGGWTGLVDPESGIPLSSGLTGIDWAAAPQPAAPIESGWSGPVDQYGVPVSAGFSGFGPNGEWVGDTSSAYASSAFLPPPQEPPSPAVQPAVDLYTADNEMMKAAQPYVYPSGKPVAA